MKLVNLMPYTIVVRGDNGVKVATIPPSGVVAKASSIFSEDGRIPVVGGFISVVKNEFGRVAGLPDPEPDTMFIVSPNVLVALRDKRQDVVAPDTSSDSVDWDDQNYIVGVHWLTR